MKLISDAPQEIDEFVGAFEAVRYRQIDVDLSEFVPSRTHPLYRDVVVEVIRVDLEHSWRQGTPKKIADYRQIFADVLADKNYLEPVAFEEYRLRRIAGEAVTREHYQQSYDLVTDTWPDLPIGQVAERSVDSIGASLGQPFSSDEFGSRSSLLSNLRYRLPEVGERFLEFELVSELGRGALGRVYLARQGDLARRFVALKITAQGCEEAQRLAQLQHTNIVPIYSFHRHESLQAVCMPFLGRRTLADVVHSYRCGQPFPDSGQAMIGTLGVHFASTLSTDQTAEEQAAAIESQCRMLPRTEVVRRIESMSFIDAAAWMISRVADGLAHAHEHGIVHRDLKPANILLSDDGEPLILDFHLSAHRPSDAVNGGTLPYMSVEQLKALQDSGEIGPPSDIYSLGVILFELLTGTTPYPIRLGTFQSVLSQMLEDRRQLAPSVRGLNKRVSCDLDSIVAKCLAAEPARRYQTARQLHEDLVLHLEHCSLRHAANRSLVERSRKWVRRHPRLFSASSMAAFAATLIIGLTISLSIYSQRLKRTHAAEASREIQSELTDARINVNSVTIERQLLEQSISRVKRLLDKLGVFASIDLKSVAPYRDADPVQRGEVKEDIAELLYLLAAGTGQLAQISSGDERENLAADALRFNQLALDVLKPRPPALALLVQRNRLSEVAGKEHPFSNISLPSWSESDPAEWRMLSTEAQKAHDFRRAVELLEKVRRSEPQDPSVWFSLGSCYLNLKQLADAEHCFGTAIAFKDDLLLAYELRGFARLHQHKQLRRYWRANVQKLRDSLKDFESVLKERPSSTSALVNRSLALAELGELDEENGNHEAAMNKFGDAIEDLSKAMKNENFPTRLYFLRAQLRRRVGDSQGADADRADGLRLTPNDEASWVARGVALLPTDQQAALEDFQAAIDLNPRSELARQNIAHVYSEQLKQPEEAIRVLTEMLELDPENAQTRVDRGVLLARLHRREEATADAVATIGQSDDPFMIYQCACIYALNANEHLADADTAIQLIGRALRDEVALSRYAAKDPDLNSIRTRPEFRTILNAALTLQQNH